MNLVKIRMKNIKNNNNNSLKKSWMESNKNKYLSSFRGEENNKDNDNIINTKTKL